MIFGNGIEIHQSVGPPNLDAESTAWRGGSKSYPNAD